MSLTYIPATPRTDLTGQKLGRLLPLRFGTFGPTRAMRSVWECLCDCGSIAYHPTANLTRELNPVRSCRCLKLEHYEASKAKVADSVADEMVALYVGGLGSTQTARRFGHTHHTLERLLADRGIPLRRHSRRVRSRLSAQELAILETGPRAADMYAQGLGSPSISRQLGRPLKHVQRAMRKQGVVIRHCTVNRDYFQVIDTEDKAYWLGFLAGDGSLGSKRHYAVRLRLAERDRAHVELFRSSVGSTHAITDRVAKKGRGKGKRSVGVSVTCKKMWSDLMRHGLTPNKSLTCPAWAGPPELLRHYWRGAVDADGWLSISRGQWMIGLVGSEPMVRAFGTYVTSLCGTRAQPRPRPPIWSMQVFSTRLAVPVIRHLYAGAEIVLPRKGKRAALAMVAAPA